MTDQPTTVVHELRLESDEDGVALTCKPCGWESALGWSVTLSELSEATDRHDREQQVRVVERWSSGPQGPIGPAGSLSEDEVAKIVQEVAAIVRRMVKPEALVTS